MSCSSLVAPLGRLFAGGYDVPSVLLDWNLVLGKERALVMALALNFLGNIRNAGTMTANPTFVEFLAAQR